MDPLVNNSIYDFYGERWYTAQDDPVALLRAECKAKLPWVLQKLSERGVPQGSTILDVGCGAGFLSNALATHGYQVTGVDTSEESLRVAGRYDTTNSVTYQAADAYRLPFADRTFDVVTAMDFLEHVDQPQKVIQEVARVLRPGGIFFYHTFNRNWLSHLVIIKMVEWLVKNTPKHMHVINLFLKPKEVAAFCEQAGLHCKQVVGLRPVLSSIPVRSLMTGVVPESLRFKIVRSTLLSYLGYAIKT